MSDRVSPEGPPQKRARLSPDPANSPPKSASSVVAAPPASADTLVQPEQPIAANIAPVLTDLEKEVKAGITEYVCPGNLGFVGVLKQRYSDFLVNEIGLDGKVVHLRTIGLGKKEKEAEEQNKNDEKVNTGAQTKQQSEVKTEGQPEIKIEGQPEETNEALGTKTQDAQEPSDKQGLQAMTELPESDQALLHSIFGEKVTKDIVALVVAVNQHPERKARDFRAVTSGPIADKWDRTKAHQCLRAIFPNKLESSTGDDDTITIKPLPPRDRGQKRKREDDGGRNAREGGRRQGRRTWDELGGEYLHFSLYKENKDTMEVVGFLGSKTKLGPKGFGFAGTKDKRGVTVQRVSAKRITAEALDAIGQQLRNAAIGDFSYHKDPLELGDLSGNEFVITLRDCHFEKEEGLDFTQRLDLAEKVLTQAVKDFSEKGFLNYYGLQRFGTFAASTDAIGVKMLQGDLEGAIADILDFSPIALTAAEAEGTDSDETGSRALVSRDDKARAKALNIWKTKRDAPAALAILPRRFSAEHNIIRHLGFKNKRTSDLDRIKDYQGALAQIPRSLRLMYVHAYQSFVWNVVAGKRWTLYGDKVVAGDLVLVHEHKVKAEAPVPTKEELDQDGEIIRRATVDPNTSSDGDFERARPLTEEEAESGKYNILDVVLPLPGFDVEYPPNTIGDFYKEFMGSKAGGGLDPHNMRRKWKDISLSGGYRKVLARPLKGVQFEIKPYITADEQFVETDLEKIKKETTSNKENGAVDTEMSDLGAADKVAVILRLQLGTSQYATMALRELLKAGGVKTFMSEFMSGR